MNIKIVKRKPNRCYGQNSLYVSFPYDFEVVQKIRSFPVRYWSPETKEWELPEIELDKLYKMFPSATINYVDTVSVKEVDFKFKTKPFSHQLDSFNYALNHDKWLLGDEMGLGKTKQIIDIAVYNKIVGKHCLIICGVNGLKWNWVNEIHTHSNEGAYILGQKQVKNKIVIGSNNDKLNALKMLNKNTNSISEYFIITNVETLRNAEIQAEFSKLCKKEVFNIIAVDEVHKCKNAASQQGKGLLKLQAPIMIAMTGTPLMNNPLDVYIILKWLGYEKHAMYSFKNHYCVMGGFGGHEIVGYKNLNQLQSQLDTIMLRRKKEDVLDLPEKTYIDEFVEMTPKQSQIYKEVTATIKTEIDQIKISPNPLAALIRLRQATGCPEILSSTISESAKLDRMEEIVDETVANGNKVVIFSNWTQIVLPVYDRLSKKHRGTYITGEIDDAKRSERVSVFQNRDDYKFIVGTIGAVGTGLTLTAGTVEIFLDEPWNMALKEQCVDRCHRIGQKNNITIYTIMAKGTIDERIHDIVNKKGMMADAIVDGKIVGNKQEFIDFLLS